MDDLLLYSILGLSPTLPGLIGGWIIQFLCFDTCRAASKRQISWQLKQVWTNSLIQQASFTRLGFMKALMTFTYNSSSLLASMILQSSITAKKRLTHKAWLPIPNSLDINPSRIVCPNFFSPNAILILDGQPWFLTTGSNVAITSIYLFDNV